MARKDVSESVVVPDVVHPVYLDASMMIDFLASLSDGVSFTSDIAQKIDTGRKGTMEGGLSVETGGLADLIGMKLSGNGKLGRESTRAESVENKFVRQHTLASLFNQLRVILESQNNIFRPDQVALASVEPGTLVEIEGVIDRNPLDALSQMYDDFRPYAITQKRQEVRRGMQPSNFTSPDEYEEAVRAKANLEYRDIDEMFEVVKKDLQKGNIIDLPMEADDFNVLIVASREYYTDQVEAAMLGGTFKVLGKVSGMDLEEDSEALTIVRRGAISFIGEERLQLLMNSMENSDIELRIPPLTLESPWVQVIPLAIYV